MPLSPEEIAQKSFSEATIGGYDPAEVEPFLAELADQYRAVLSLEAEQEINSLRDSDAILRTATEWAAELLHVAEQRGESIERDASELLERTRRETEKNQAGTGRSVRKEAEAILRRAKLQARKLVEQTERRVAQMAEKEERRKQRVSILQYELLKEAGALEEAARALVGDLAAHQETSPEVIEPISILIVSRDDQSLSPMTAGLLRQALSMYGCEDIEVRTAGTHAVAGRHANAQEVGFLNAHGVDISGHRARPLHPEELEKTDLAVAMTQADLEWVVQRVPSARIVLLRELGELSPLHPPADSLRDRVRALSAQALRHPSDVHVSEPTGRGPGLYRRGMEEIKPVVDALVAVLLGKDPRPAKVNEYEILSTEPILFEWVKHYTAFVGLAVLLGLSGALLYLFLAPQSYQASTLVVETGREISPRQLALVSQATFSSPAVLEPTIERLGYDHSVQEFANHSVDLRPIPDSSVLLVIGRSASVARAQDFSRMAAGSFVQVSNAENELMDFAIFGRSEIVPVQERIATSVAMVLGGMVGLWLGLSLAIIHYRSKRPVLRFANAQSAIGADEVTIVKGKWSSLGLLRPMRSQVDAVKRELGYNDSSANETIREPWMTFTDNGTKFIIAHSGTGQKQLELSCGPTPDGVTDGDDRGVRLVWLR